MKNLVKSVIETVSDEHPKKEIFVSIFVLIIAMGIVLFS